MTAEKALKIEAQGKSHKIGYRHVQALLMLFGVFFVYILRVNISAAIVPMTQAPGQNHSDGFPTYNWGPSTKSFVLSSFFWGYAIGQVPNALLAKRFGVKKVLGSCTIVTSIIAILHPVGVTLGGWELLCALRVLSGITQSSLYTCINMLMVKWVPQTERGFLSMFINSGLQIGATVILGTSGIILKYMGWPGIFYVSGGMALIWALIFICFSANDPDQSKFVSKAECDYIKSLTYNSENDTAKLPVPWMSMFTSPPLLSLIASLCAFTWGFYTLLTQIPIYMNSVLQLDLQSNALLSALPYFAMWVLGFLISPISDWLINRGSLSVTASRKLFNTLGEWVPMLCLIALGFMTKEDKVTAIALLTIAVAFGTCTYCGFYLNLMDLAPNFAGVIMSIGNCMGCTLSIFAPLAVGAIVKNEEDPMEWRIVFFIAAGVYLIGNLLFLIFGKINIQSWNEPLNSVDKISPSSHSQIELKDANLNGSVIGSGNDNTKPDLR